MLLLLYIFDALVEGQLTVYVWVDFWVFYSIPYLCVWCLWWCHAASVTTAMEDGLKSESVMPPALSFLKVALAIWGLLRFHMIQQPHFCILIQRNLNQNLKEIPVLPCLL